MAAVTIVEIITSLSPHVQFELITRRLIVTTEIAIHYQEANEDITCKRCITKTVVSSWKMFASYSDILCHKLNGNATTYIFLGYNLQFNFSQVLD